MVTKLDSCRGKWSSGGIKEKVRGHQLKAKCEQNNPSFTGTFSYPTADGQRKLRISSEFYHKSSRTQEKARFSI